MDDGVPGVIAPIIDGDAVVFITLRGVPAKLPGDALPSLLPPEAPTH